MDSCGSDFVRDEAINRQKKVFARDVFLRSPDGKWTRIGELPQPVAEGVSASLKDGVFCAGGNAGRRKYKNAFILRRDASREDLPDLPEPVSMAAAAVDGETIYVVSSNKVFRLEPGISSSGWKVFVPCTQFSFSTSVKAL